MNLITVKYVAKVFILLGMRDTPIKMKIQYFKVQIYIHGVRLGRNIVFIQSK